MLDTLNFPAKSATGWSEIKKLVPNVPRGMQFFIKKIHAGLKPGSPAANGEYLQLLTYLPHVVGDLVDNFPWEDLLWSRLVQLGAVPEDRECDITDYIEKFLPAGADALYLYSYTTDENGVNSWGMVDVLLVNQPDIKRRFDHKEYQGG